MDVVWVCGVMVNSPSGVCAIVTEDRTELRVVELSLLDNSNGVQEGRYEECCRLRFVNATDVVVWWVCGLSWNGGGEKMQLRIVFKKFGSLVYARLAFTKTAVTN